MGESLFGFRQQLREQSGTLTDPTPLDDTLGNVETSIYSGKWDKECSPWEESSGQVALDRE